MLPQRKSLSQIKKSRNVKRRSLIPSKKVVKGGIKFDSQAEADYAVLMHDNKSITDLRYHPKVEILPGVTWELDFSYTNRVGGVVYIDVKGMRITEAARIKIKIWAAVVPHTLHVVKKDPHSGLFLTEDCFRGSHKYNIPFKVLDPGKKM